MYLKLTLRNARRSIFDYLLYMITITIFFTIMVISNYVSRAGKMEAGFQTAALPFLITILLVILTGYVNDFLLRQRAKEFANYMLLGMNRDNLSLLYLLEFLFIGLVCFIIGCLAGSLLFLFFFSSTAQGLFEGNITAGIHSITFFMQCLMQSFLYFCMIEILPALRIKKIIDSLHIRELMIMKECPRNNRRTRKISYYLSAFLICFFIFILLLLGIVLLPNDAKYIIVPFLSIPMLFSIFAFYTCIFQYMLIKRESKKMIPFFQKNHLYIIAELTNKSGSNIIMNSIFSICLLFSAICFLFGKIMILTTSVIFDAKNQRWMGFLQICMCIIFIVLYFSILSLKQMIEIKQELNHFTILHHLGKNEAEIQTVLKQQIIIKLTLPAIMCSIQLLTGIIIINIRPNRPFPSEINQILLNSALDFSISFLFLYFVYFGALYVMGKRYIKTAIFPSCK